MLRDVLAFFMFLSFCFCGNVTLCAYGYEKIELERFEMFASVKMNHSAIGSCIEFNFDSYNDKRANVKLYNSSSDINFSQILEIDFSCTTSTLLIESTGDNIKHIQKAPQNHFIEVTSPARRIVSNFAEKLNPSTWMQDMGSMAIGTYSLGSLSLVDIVLPGTHDSGTFNLTTKVVQPPDSFVGVIDEACTELNQLGIDINCNDTQEVAEVLSLPWSITQTKNWFGQLQTGCRSFDYRAYFNPNTNKWVAQHSLYGTNKTSPAELSFQVSRFLEENPGELVIIEYKIYGSGNKEDLVAEFLKGLGNFGYNWIDGVEIPGNPSIADMIMNNQRAILVEENGGQRDPVTQGIVNDYPDSCNKTEILDYDAHAIDLFAKEKPDAMRKLGFQDTVNAECIVAGTAGDFIIPGNVFCEDLFGFKCSPDLLGYINQLNSFFTLDYVLSSYATSKPISEAIYFGNLWNFDNPDWSFVRYVASLNALTLFNNNK